LVALHNISKVYFLGIGGIGMSALARYFLQQGIAVSGYDKTPSALTTQLAVEGADIHFDDGAHLFPKNPELVIYTPAIPKEQEAMAYYTANGIAMYKRSEVLQAITANYTTLAVAGTHGKTTTSSLVSHIFRNALQTTETFLGGISANYNTNYWKGNGNTLVVEADEYDRSFHRLLPTAAIITSMDADHLDIYGTVENMHEAFLIFIDKIQKGGYLFYKKGLPVVLKRNKDITYTSYHVSDNTADIYAKDIEVKNGLFHCKASVYGKVYEMTMATGGRYNIENALAAIGICLSQGLAIEDIVKGINSFTGVKRRFEYIVRNEKNIFIDDYAHHPTELHATVTAAKELYPTKKCTLVFQPHLYSRTRDFAKEFATCLSMADKTILLPIYPARELPIEGVSSEMIASTMTNDVEVLDKAAYVEWVQHNNCELLVSTGAGDIDLLNNEIKEILEAKI
jgi:UDP-N-acetylmuramate--alanine ligase